MVNSITAQTNPVDVRTASYGSITYYNVTLDTSAQTDVITAADAANRIGLVYCALQNNSGANAITIAFKSGSNVRYQKVLAVGAELLLALQRNPHVITDINAALNITGTGTTPVVAGVVGTAKAKIFEL
jgi:hypothetical protein